MIQQTSLMAYFDFLSRVSDRQKQILILLQQYGPCTDLELSYHANIKDPNYIRPRRNELVKLGIVKECGKRKCNISGKTAIIWKVIR